MNGEGFRKKEKLSPFFSFMQNTIPETSLGSNGAFHLLK
ncbi:hypothetical protein LEP1GSC124_0093 [Leptospira interrogans serovar Pyrogenes str. 200701872]|nr:hypothetical protein LEP1GSC124_0093 [Leptospira interrogans serovar Pyrogenes str. 200701872]